MMKHHLQAAITAAVLLDDDTLVLFGAIERPVPATAPVLLDGTVAGQFGGRCWTDPADGLRWFLGAVRVAELSRMRPSRVEIVADDGEHLMLPRLTNVRTNPSHIVSALEKYQPDAFDTALDFACALASSQDEPSERLERFLSALADEAVKPDGVVELVGRFRDGSLMIQGWAHALRPGTQKLLVEGQGRRLHRAVAASFARSDLTGGAHGIVAVLADQTEAPADITRVHYRGAEGWRCIKVLEPRRILPDGAASAHLRDMVPTLGDGQAQLAIRQVLASRYEGYETVSRLGAPVRIAVDMTLRVPGVGFFVTGWLLDPTAQVESVVLKGPGMTARLDADWTRVRRKDVSDAFADDPLFAGRIEPGQDGHGFSAFAAEPAGVPENGEFHLQLTLTGESVGFWPLTCARPSPAAQRRMLAAVNLDSPAIERVIARHVGPMVRGAAKGRSGAAAGCHAMGPELESPRVSVLLPVTDGREDIDLNLVRLAADPDFRDAEVLVVAAAGTHERLAGTVRQAAGFYRIAVRFVSAPGATDAFEAVAAALPHARADRVLLLSPSVLPTARGWLSALEQVSLSSGAPIMVSPTLLYEDHSIRFAGIVAVKDADGGTLYEARYAGYPRDWPRERDAARVDAASADCALVGKEALARALSMLGSYVGAEHKGLDLCLRLRAAGVVCVWLPRVALVALDEQPRDAHADRWRRAGAMVDRWIFQDSWSARTAA
ncbi:MAG TPA: hypothetical protein VD978_19665 [Azospirillum sp.]|nr:hypothetical protein [Azospirillum sp.]